MRIVHLSTSDISGGAARAAFRLHTALKRAGHDSQMLVARKSGTDPEVVAFRPPQGRISKWKRRWRNRSIWRDFARYNDTRPAGYELFSDDRTEHAGEVARQIQPCDLINLHWVAGFIDYRSIFANAPRNVPLVWRLADMAAYTGGCHYDFGCGKFAQQCGACPQLGSTDSHDLSHQIWQRKDQSLRQADKKRLHIVAPSEWTAGQARRSSLFRELAMSVIPNGLDIEDFAPRDKDFARDLWKIPNDADVILFAAESLEIRRKGFAELLEALKELNGVAKPFLLSVGGLKSEIEVPIPHLNLGKITSDRLLSIAYSAADIFVIPSLQESFGQTATESLACGTPVVGFASGGIAEIVRPGITGWLAPTGDVAALRQAVTEALSSPDRRRTMSEECRRTAMREYSLETQAQNYTRLYETLISDARENPSRAREGRRNAELSASKFVAAKPAARIVR